MTVLQQTSDTSLCEERRLCQVTGREQGAGEPAKGTGWYCGVRPGKSARSAPLPEPGDVKSGPERYCSVSTLSMIF